MELLPKISIVTPSFNQGQFIEETITSVINQNYPNLEYIIIDGGSTDNTVDIIKKYEKYITYWVSEADKGQSHAINKGLAQCKGDVFNWLNSDDYYEPGALIQIGKAFQDPNIFVFSGRERRVNEKGVEIGMSNGTSILNTLSETVGKCHIDQPSTFFRLSALKPLLPFDSSFHYLMDGEMWLRYLLYYGQGHVKKIDKVLVNFRLHESSKTVSSSQRFQVDKNTFENNLLKNFVIDNSIKTILLDRESCAYSKKLKINHPIDENVIVSFFCARSIVKFYGIGKYKEARECLQLINNCYPRLYALSYPLRYYRGLLILPDFLLSFLRYIKHSMTKDIVSSVLYKLYRLYLRHHLDKYGIYPYRPTIKQDALFLEALDEFSISHRGIRVDHRNAKCYNGNEMYNIIFPMRYINRINELSKNKIYKYCFKGKYTQSREWTKSYISNENLIEFTNKGREQSKGFFDEEYYQMMCNSEFVLCPKGDYLWTYRFYEAIMCSSVPVVEASGIEPSMNGFIYYIRAEDDELFVYDKNICAENYKLFLKRHTLCLDHQKA